MDKKKKFQVVIMVAAVFLCGILYLVLGNGTLFDSNGDENPGEGVFTAGEAEARPEETKQAEEPDGNPGSDRGQEVFVYVCGAVKKPGVYTFDHSPRLVEAVDKAGGLTKKADPTSINMASLLEDGAQVVIYEKGEPATGSIGDGNTSTGEEGGTSDRVDINTAGHEELTTIPGIGDAKASAIEDYRKEHGRFQKPEDLMQISGIKQGIFDRIKDYIRV